MQSLLMDLNSNRYQLLQRGIDNTVKLAMQFRDMANISFEEPLKGGVWPYSIIKVNVPAKIKREERKENSAPTSIAEITEVAKQSGCDPGIKRKWSLWSYFVSGSTSP